jgi:cbb3-type cytochrome oxidase subunit 3
MGYYEELRDAAYPYNYVLDSITLVITVSGIILSSLVLYVAFKRPWRGFNIDLKLVTITLLSDLFTGFICLANCLCNFFSISAYLSSRVACDVNAVLVLMPFMTSINLVGVVAVERALLVVFDTRLKVKYYYILIGGLGAINIANALISLIYDAYTIQPSTMYCLYDISRVPGRVSSILLLVSAFASLGMVYIGYVLIVFKKRQRERNIRNNLRHLNLAAQHQPSSTTMKSLIIILVSSATNLPYFSLVLVALIDSSFWTPAIDTICTSLIMLNQVINTMLVLLMRYDLSDGLKVLLGIKSKNLDQSVPLGSNVSYQK